MNTQNTFLNHILNNPCLTHKYNIYIKFSLLRNITNSAIEIYLEVDAFENMSVRVLCRLVSAETFCWQVFFFQNFSNFLKTV